jgi:hypothetical protein
MGVHRPVLGPEGDRYTQGLAVLLGLGLGMPPKLVPLTRARPEGHSRAGHLAVTRMRDTLHGEDWLNPEGK